MVKRSLILSLLLYLACASYAQEDSSSVQTRSRRLGYVIAGNAIFYASTYLVLNQAWYAGYEKTKFHFFNDNPEWNQVDKAGHVWSTYHVSRFSSHMWRWAGLSHTQSAIAGGVSGMMYQSIIELQDAYSAAWGFSWGDVAANVAGASLFVAQDIGWKEQRITLKMGYHPYAYPTGLKHRRDELFGRSVAERVLKDYNSQTYWISANLSSVLQNDQIPAWLNLAAGYSADGMYGGRTNMWSDDEGQAYDFSHIPRRRRFYLSPDIDLTRIPSRNKTVRSILSVVNAFRIPLPALELSSGKIRAVIR